MMVPESDNRTKVKICGITTLEDARFVSGALADYVGFIFYPKSPRYIEPAKAGAIINWLEGPEKVGVFVNQPLDDVNNIAKQTGLDIVQLHGTESAEYCGLIELPVIKVFHISQETTGEQLVKTMEPYMGIVDYFLFDTKNDSLWGGTGTSFDWNIIDSLQGDTPFFLSGGLSNDNIQEAINTVSPNTVDLSSALEEAPGLKDFEKIEHFFETMRVIWEKQEKM